MNQAIDNDRVRREWTEMRDRVSQVAIESKKSEAAVEDLSEAYRRLSEGERQVVDTLLAEWLEGDDSPRRFDAIALISMHKIRLALPALARLAVRLETDRGPGAPYERAKALRTIEALARERGPS